ncbi:MAG: ABC transporter ATP-binding protein [Clostridium sp.]|nr:ABC transporter ATP-binding protein [Clostridium sp.]
MSKDLTYSIKIKNLSCTLGNEKILHSIDLKLEKKKFYSIIGPNGSGKTTLLKNISKSLEPLKSTVFIEGADIRDLRNKSLAKKLSCVPQNTEINFDFSVMDIVLMGRTPYIKNFQSESSADIEIAKNAMNLTNTWHLKDKNINDLSGGERQLVIIARAIAQETDILLLDEPISNLDIHHQIKILDTIKTLNIEKNITVITVLHDLNLAAQYSDYLILINQGKIQANGLCEDVLTKENIKKVYNMDTCILKNPVTGKPLIIPIGKKF